MYYDRDQRMTVDVVDIYPARIISKSKKIIIFAYADGSTFRRV